jgi:hypothetical protein
MALLVLQGEKIFPSQSWTRRGIAREHRSRLTKGGPDRTFATHQARRLSVYRPGIRGRNKFEDSGTARERVKQSCADATAACFAFPRTRDKSIALTQKLPSLPTLQVARDAGTTRRDLRSTKAALPRRIA